MIASIGALRSSFVVRRTRRPTSSRAQQDHGPLDGARDAPAAGRAGGAGHPVRADAGLHVGQADQGVAEHRAVVADGHELGLGRGRRPLERERPPLLVRRHHRALLGRDVGLGLAGDLVDRRGQVRLAGQRGDAHPGRRVDGAHVALGQDQLGVLVTGDDGVAAPGQEAARVGVVLAHREAQLRLAVGLGGAGDPAQELAADALAAVTVQDAQLAPAGIGVRVVDQGRHGGHPDRDAGLAGDDVVGPLHLAAERVPGRLARLVVDPHRVADGHHRGDVGIVDRHLPDVEVGRVHSPRGPRMDSQAGVGR